ncbi:MAG TPA: HutD family protein [Burkholderiaceae bacterium]|jgi:hypothetical protein
MQPTAFNDLHAVPWKNGGGVTRELACFPPGAGFDDFTWRISIADVNATGPFSSFPGIDRIITLLDGDGMRLEFSDCKLHGLTEKLLPFSFPGEAQVHAELVGAPSRDFNLMLRRGRATGRVDVLRASGIIASNNMLIYCVGGRWRLGTEECVLHAGDHVLLEGGMTGAKIDMLEPDGALLCVKINLTD